MTASLPAMPTIGTIAAELGVPLHKVRYIVESRHIEPTGRAGNCRIFTPSDVARIASELRRIAEDKGEFNGR